jgi:hypothetical protein
LVCVVAQTGVNGEAVMALGAEEALLVAAGMYVSLQPLPGSDAVHVVGIAGVVVTNRKRPVVPRVPFPTKGCEVIRTSQPETGVVASLVGKAPPSLHCDGAVNTEPLGCQRNRR